MKKTLIKKLITMLTFALIISVGLLTFLMAYNRKTSLSTTSKLGNLYISEMMYQVQDHFETIIDIKNKEVAHIANHTVFTDSSNYRELLKTTATDMDFDYLALFDENSNYDTILGEDAWYRNLNGFIDDINAGKTTATTGYLTNTGDKYLVFGIPAQYEMASGKTSHIMLMGFSVDKLYNYINLDELQQLGGNASVDIILTNGSYVLNALGTTQTSFYDHIESIGSFVDMSLDEGVYCIEKAMSSSNSFSTMVTLQGDVKHIYGSPAGIPGDWYFVISMPQGPSDAIISTQNTSISHAFLFSGFIILIIFVGVFILYLRLSMHQIEETEAAKNEAEKARAEAETANKAKSAFLSNMSHDIRTPMNAIVGFTEIIEANITAKNYNTALEYILKMKRSSDYLRNLICDVLDMSKIESGALTLSLEAISLDKTIDTVTTITNTHIARNRQTLKVDIHDIIHDGFSCDRTRLKQVLINLLSNAMKFTPAEGTITLEVWQEKSSMGDDFIKNCFAVTDTGIGMSKEFLKIMYDSFSREDSKVRKIEGTGLGLTITKSLVDMMGGTITANSQEGKGSTFLVTINSPKAYDIQHLDEKSLDSLDIEGIRILLAEDNDFNYDIAEVLLGSYGFITTRAENGQIAVDKYCENPKNWDLILMDLRMPILNGYEAATKIREYESTCPDKPHIPILALSADVFAEDIEHCLDVGMNGHIAKPINIRELLHTLKQHLDI